MITSGYQIISNRHNILLCDMQVTMRVAIIEFISPSNDMYTLYKLSRCITPNGPMTITDVCKPVLAQITRSL